MQAIGHQVVGSKNSHEDVKLMYETFFGRKAASIKGVLKGHLGSIKTKQVLSQIFQVLFVSNSYHSKLVTCYLMISSWSL